MKTLQITLLLFARMYVEAFLVQQGSREPDAVQALIVYNGVWWGTWHRPEFCPKGSFANGYSMKIEWDQNGGDDTSLNSIKLRCIFEDGSFAGEVASGQGSWGTWHSLHICPFIPGELNLLTSFALKVEPDQAFTHMAFCGMFGGRAVILPESIPGRDRVDTNILPLIWIKT